jgi:hypothetical protein
MKNILKVVAVAAVAVVLTQSVQAVPITGVIGFSGTATANASTASSSTEILSWGASFVGNLHTGTFSTLVPSSSTVSFASPWFYDTGSLNNFWVLNDTVNNVTYRFNLSSSSIFSTGSLNGLTTITVFLAGTVISNVAGETATAFTGTMAISDPSSDNGNGTFNYTEQMSFGSVPDGGTTALLLGSALSGLALLRRKLSA